MSWKSSKQEIVADSATEAEYITATDVAKEAVWMRKFIAKPIMVYCDNNKVIV